MDTIDQLSAVLPSLSSLVDHLWHGQLEERVPSGGTVHEALDRLMVMGATYTYWLQGDSAPEITPPAVYGWVPAGEFREVMDDLLAAAKDAVDADRILHTPMGTMTATELSRVIAVGVVLNGRELAAVTGRSFDVPADVLATVDPFAHAPA